MRKPPPPDQGQVGTGCSGAQTRPWPVFLRTTDPRPGSCPGLFHWSPSCSTRVTQWPLCPKATQHVHCRSGRVCVDRSPSLARASHCECSTLTCHCQHRWTGDSNPGTLEHVFSHRDTQSNLLHLTLLGAFNTMWKAELAASPCDSRLSELLRVHPQCWCIPPCSFCCWVQFCAPQPTTHSVQRGLSVHDKIAYACPLGKHEGWRRVSGDPSPPDLVLNAITGSLRALKAHFTCYH